MSGSANDKKIIAFEIGLEDQSKKLLHNVGKEFSFVNYPYDMDKLMELPDEPPTVVFCGPPPEDVPVAEVAQLLRMKYQNTAIYFVVGADKKYDRATVIKNGFTEVFFLPIDTNFFSTSIAEVIQSALNTSTKIFRPIKLVDIEADSVMEFDTYIFLPANNKHIKYSAAGKSMESKKVEKLKTHNMSSIFVDKEDMPKFYEYTAKALRKLGNNSNISETERNERLKTAVRDVVTGLFSDTTKGTEGGRKIVEDCQNIVKNYISSGQQGDLYKKVLATAGDTSGAYSHFANVSTYASMFAIGLGMKTVEEIALAGLLHDVGLAMVPSEIQSKTEEEMTKEEKLIYEQHVEQSIAIIQSRKLVVPELVYKIILQHHETYNGSGYPKKLVGNRILPEAQVLAFADRFDEMTGMVPGRPRKKPAEALIVFRKMLGNLTTCPFEPTLLKKLLGLFPAPEVEAKAS